MPEFFQNWTPQAYGIWVGITAFFAWWGNQWLERRKLSAADRQANREGFDRQVTSLQVENRELRRELREMRVTLQERERDHDDYRRMCRDETDQLRDELNLLTNELAGMKRKYDHLREVIERRVGLTPDDPETPRMDER